MTMLSAQASVLTPRASRYLKALCNHFDRKVTAEYDDNRGTVNLGFGTCQMVAEADSLVIRVQADDEQNFTRVKYIVSDHLTRFSGEEALHVEWNENA